MTPQQPRKTPSWAARWSPIGAHGERGAPVVSSRSTREDPRRIRGRPARPITRVGGRDQRPVAELAFSEPNGAPAWKDLPSWAVVALSDKAAGTDVVRSMAERAGATITEVEGSAPVIMISQPDAVTNVILDALATVTAPVAVG